ncbi:MULTISPECIES: antitoxin Xre/MbcA/ParS toxin-binding domain-containing protein [Pseudomonas]|uniref:antitoxin Xre/MbcA/ParS toxin-binding domain-containing protein n=1 Tax=Pseudomonas TaxID=286 RepID=UPI001C435A78|nr:antitoxin Xre/MbcA/ParS toxin-binding domain-containing protein [Pseudomonas tolaasii]
MSAAARFSININDVGPLQRRTENFFDNKQKRRWLNHPKTELGGLTPLQFAPSESGHAFVKDALEIINQGYTY